MQPTTDTHAEARVRCVSLYVFVHIHTSMHTYTPCMAFTVANCHSSPSEVVSFFFFFYPLTLKINLKHRPCTHDLLK